jgi:hypothetical protein
VKRTGAHNNAPASISALVARGEILLMPASVCFMSRPNSIGIVSMPSSPNATGAARFHRGSNRAGPVKPTALHVSAMELLRGAAVGAAS